MTYAIIIIGSVINALFITVVMRNYQKKKHSPQDQLCTLHGVRVRFYLCDYDEDIWVTLPARVNNGDSFYMDCFVGEHEEKTLDPQTYEDMIEGAILYCSSSIWGQNKKGIYQQVYLVDESQS